MNESQPDGVEKDPVKDVAWFDRPSSKRLLWGVLWGVCVLSVIAEIAMMATGHARHGHFSFDGWAGYYAVFGFASCAVSIGLAKLLGLWLKAREDYYDDAP